MNDKSARKMPLWAKILCIVLAVIIFIAAALGITFVSVWHNEISTVNSFKLLRVRNDDNKEGGVYSMNVKGGFYFDDFLKKGGASSDTQLIGFITKNITKGLIGMSIEESDVNCSAFMATTPESDILFGRNYDFDKTNVCITITENPGKNRYKSFSTVDLNYVGIDPDADVTGLMDKITCLAAPYAPLDGMNEKGLSCAIFMSYQGNIDTESGTVATNQNDSEKPNITSTTMLRMILDYAADVDEAVELISKYNLHDSAKSSFHYMLADANGKSAILEWLPENGTDKTDNDGSARKLVVTYNTDAMYDSLRGASHFKYQWITNFIVSNSNSYYESDEEKGGYDRYAHIYSRLSEKKGVLTDEREAMQILSEVGQRTWHGGCTVHSAVFNLTKKSVLWVANENYSDASAYYEYTFDGGLKKLS